FLAKRVPPLLPLATGQSGSDVRGGRGLKCAVQVNVASVRLDQRPARQPHSSRRSTIRWHCGHGRHYGRADCGIEPLLTIRAIATELFDLSYPPRPGCAPSFQTRLDPSPGTVGEERLGWLLEPRRGDALDDEPLEKEDDDDHRDGREEG